MDHRQARKTGWTIIVCGCFFIILSQLWVGLAMAALGLLLIILGGRCPHCGKILLLVPPAPPSAPGATGRCCKAPGQQGTIAFPPRGSRRRGSVFQRTAFH